MIRTRNLLMKIIWVLCILASLGYCSYTVIKSIINYMSYDTILQTRIIQEFPSDFPAVTFCDLKQARQNKSQVLNMNESIKIRSCKFNNELCSSNDFKRFQHAYYGTCYTFNSNLSSIRKVYRAGTDGGLDLKIECKFHEF